MAVPYVIEPRAAEPCTAGSGLAGPNLALPQLGRSRFVHMAATLHCLPRFRWVRAACMIALAALGSQTLVTPAAEARQERVESVVLRVFPMKNQPARHALPLIDPLLSASGTVSFQQDDNALVVRDRASVLEKLQPVLGDFDHPIQELSLEMYLLRASRIAPAASRTPATSSRDGSKRVALPTELVTELDNILRLNSYEPLGSAKLQVNEGEQVRSEVGPNHEFSFEVGTVLRNRYLRLSDFRLLRITEAGGRPVVVDASKLRKQVYRSDINLKFERPAFITVSRDATSASGLVMAFVWTPIPSRGVSPTLPVPSRPATTNRVALQVGDR